MSDLEIAANFAKKLKEDEKQELIKLLQRKLGKAMRLISTIEECSTTIDDWVVDEAREVRREIEEME